MTQPSFTVDAFHRGRFHLVQPRDRGHRAGLDAMLLAAAVPRDFAGRLADLGAGAGAAGLAAAARAKGAEVFLVENSVEMAACARMTLALTENAWLCRRVHLIEADVTLTGRARVAAGLADNHFGFVIANPPFNDPRDRASPDPLRARAHAMPAEGLEAWFRTAAAILQPRATLALIARPAALDALLNAMRGRFGAIDLMPVHAHPGKDAIRIILRARRGARRALALCPGLVLHEAEGAGFTPVAEALINGEADLFAS